MLFLHDLRVGLRAFLRAPGFTAVAVLTLAVGIGATTTIFTFVNAIVLQPLPFRDSDRLVMLGGASRTARPTQFTTAAPGDFLDWQAQSTSFENLTAFTNTSVSITGDGGAERLRGASVTSRWFETFGVAPLLGQTLAAYEGQPDASQAVVISSDLWERRFRSDPAMVGRTIALDHQSFVVVGVAPTEFTFPRDMPLGPFRDPRPVDVWLPLELRPGDRSRYLLEVVGRIKPDVTMTQAGVEMDAIASRIGRQLPQNRNRTVRLVTLQERIVGDVTPVLFLLAGAGAFVLLIACANVANLMLARAGERRQTVAIRSALGSGRWRLVRQFVTESLILSVAGGALGLLAAFWGVEFVTTLIPPGAAPRLSEVSVDRQVLAFVLAVSLAMPLVFGMLPAILASKPATSEALKATSQTATSASRAPQLLVAAEVALAFVLVVCAGLLLDSFARLTRVDPGFQPDRVLTLGVALPETGYETTAQMAAFTDEAITRMRSVPGVSHAGVVNWLPIAGGWLSGDLIVDEPAQFPSGLNVTKTAASAGYFGAMGIPIVRGRTFDTSDAESAPRVAVVTEGLARQVWPGEDPIGKRVKLGFGQPEEQPWVTVVGVAGDVKQTALSDETQPAIYFPPVQSPRSSLLRDGLTFTVRTEGDPRDVAGALVRQLQAIDASLPVDRVATMRELLAYSVSTPRFRWTVFSSFAITALLLVVTGIVGVLSYTVTRRTREIGLRMALGARPAQVLRLIVRQALVMTTAGLLLGIVAAAFVARALASYLFEVVPLEPAVFATAALVVIVLAVGAAYLPARRAANLDPLRALRSE
jgi:putative ABC transport system permease protein